jgi:hypothetical protein
MHVHACVRVLKMAFPLRAFLFVALMADAIVVWSGQDVDAVVAADVVIPIPPRVVTSRLTCGAGSFKVCFVLDATEDRAGITIGHST